MAERRSAYGGGRWKKWVLVYLAIGAIAYLVVYFVFFHHGGGYGGGGGGGGGGYFVLPLLLGAGRRLPDGLAGRRPAGPVRPRPGRV